MKSRYFSFISLVLLIALLLTACGTPTATPEPTPTPRPRVTLTISGSGTTAAILSGIKPAFEADVPGYTLKVLPGSGTGGGVKGLLEGILDVAAMARPPKDEEAAKGIEYVEFGQSGVAIYTHADVGVTDLTSKQVLAIFSGEITNWSTVGGKNQSLILYVRDEEDSSTQTLRKVIFGEMPFPQTAQMMTSQSDMQAAVAGTPGSVGFGSWPSALAERVNVTGVALDSVAPGDSAYPLIGPIGIGYLSAGKANVQPLIDWLLSEKGQAALREFDVILSK